MKIKGPFDVQLNPLPNHLESANGIQMGHMSIAKNYSGDLSATGRGEMLSAMTETQGSAGYVAIEQVEGVLEGKSGSFVLQHFGIMNRGEDRLVLEVIPDSGTGELMGLTGKMSIVQTENQHSYEFEYDL